MTFTILCTYTSWLANELEKVDPDLTGDTKPPDMTDAQWATFQSLKVQKQQAGGGSSGSSHGDSLPSKSQDHQGEADGTKKLFELMTKWEFNFSRHLQILLDALNHYAASETVVLLSLCARLSAANHGTEFAGLRHEEDMPG